MRRASFTLQLALVVVLIVYQSNPDFQAWADYQLLRLAGWLGYAVQWGQWSLRRRVRQAERQRREEYGPDLGQGV